MSLLNVLQHCFCFKFWFFWLRGIWDLSSLHPRFRRHSPNPWTAREVLKTIFKRKASGQTSSNHFRKGAKPCPRCFTSFSATKHKLLREKRQGSGHRGRSSTARGKEVERLLYPWRKDRKRSGSKSLQTFYCSGRDRIIENKKRDEIPKLHSLILISSWISYH